MKKKNPARAIGVSLLHVKDLYQTDMDWINILKTICSFAFKGRSAGGGGGVFSSFFFYVLQMYMNKRMNKFF